MKYLDRLFWLFVGTMFGFLTGAFVIFAAVITDLNKPTRSKYKPGSTTGA